VSGDGTIDDRTPVLIGVGQFAERPDDADYLGLSAVDLAARAAMAAIEDSEGAFDVVVSMIDTVAGIRQFENSGPAAVAQLGRSSNYPRSVGARLGANPTDAILDIAGGQGPQHLLTELAGDIAAGRRNVVLVVGSEAISTTRKLAGTEGAPDFTETIEGSLDDRGFGRKGLMSRYLMSHQLREPSTQYALFENARRARLGQNRSEYAASMGSLFEPFNRLGSENPYAAAPTLRSAAELTTPTPRNRMIVDPYPRYVISHDQVNQGAAVLLTSIAAAREIGVPSDKWVYLAGHADLRERDLLDRADLSRSPASVMAVDHALSVAGITMAELATIDLYSCFPIAVFNICDGTGLRDDDPRGLTVTGGLPFFGGAGNNYSMHAVAETVKLARESPGTYGLVGANGGYLSKYSVGIYTTTPTAWRSDDSASLQAEIDSWEPTSLARRADGWSRIETATVTYDRDGSPREGIVVGRDHLDRRFLALAVGDDLIKLLAEGNPIGTPVYARSFGKGNRVAMSPERLDGLLPTRPPGFRETYEHVSIRRDDHVLVVTIERPERRNALHPPANDELDEIFDAFFADPDLWVAILTGAGGQAFSAGNDLIYTGAGNPMWIPLNGFAGLTSRPAMTKPVIAAVNGFAFGGGFEIALACHLIVADETARFALTEVKVGLAAGAGGLVRLPRAVTPKLANEMILTGRALSANEARDVGIVSRVAPPGEALRVAEELAAEILTGSPTSIRISLQVMAETEAIADTYQAVLHQSPAADELTTSEDANEGMTAFAEKRAPRWLNR
jgi:acetyl-CoA C-acetyltransferase